MQFVDRLLKCSDCGQDFVFTAGEQIFFYDKQFKNDPKRCKLCKAKRAGVGRAAAGSGTPVLPFSRTETRTTCSACGIETTVPFKPTQGRPVLCRSCFQMKQASPDAVPVGSASLPRVEEAASAALDAARPAAIEMIAQTPGVLVKEGEPAPDRVAGAAKAP
ncbi:MAG: zinc-ribbon domain containing protein [Acidobacteriota bacterium]